MKIAMVIICPRCGTRAESKPTGRDGAPSVLERLILLACVLEKLGSCPSCSPELATDRAIDLSAWRAMVDRAGGPPVS